MSSPSPTLEGFRTILRRPSFGFAEISWRWSYGAAAALLITLSLLEYLDTLPVSRLDLVLLRTRQPALVGQAFDRIFRGSGLRFVQAFVVLALGLSVVWIVVAAFARAATLKALVIHFQENVEASRSGVNGGLRSLMGLNFFRVMTAVAAAIGVFAALLLPAIASSAKRPAPGIAVPIVLMVLLMVWLAWAVVNWFLSLASVFVVLRGRDTFGSIRAAVNLCRDQTGRVFAAGAWFGLAHITAFFVATSIVALPLGLAGILPLPVVLGGVLTVTLLYFAAADFLYVGRLASYVSMIEFPPVMAVAPDPTPVPRQTSQADRPLSDLVDQDELILSDVPPN